MAKFSDLFGRKGGDADNGPSRVANKMGNGNGNGGPIHVESFSDVGSRMGEENEALRNLLSDTGRKIGELDELKEAFDKIVAPFNSTLRALEKFVQNSLRGKSKWKVFRADFLVVAMQGGDAAFRSEFRLARIAWVEKQNSANRLAKTLVSVAENDRVRFFSCDSCL